MESGDKAGEYHRGLRAFRNGDYNSAVTHLSVAVEHDEHNDKAWNALGTACAKIGRFADADLCFENAITLAPDSPIYHKNRRINAKNLNTKPELSQAPSESFLEKTPFDKIPFHLIPFDKKYVIGGAALLVLVILFAILILTGILFSSPPEPAGPPFILSATLNGSTIVLTNEGGSDLDSIRSFTWKVNDLTIGTGESNDPNTLSVIPESTSTVALADLMQTDLTSGMKVQVIANYKEGGGTLALDTQLPPPSPELLPSPEITLQPTPTLPPDVPRYREGEVIIDKKSSDYLLITTTPVNGTYTIASAARSPDGTFSPIDSPVNISYKDLEQTTQSIGLRSAGGAPPGLQSDTPPKVTGVPQIHPEPIFPAGDLVNSRKTGDEGVLVILGYDKATDQYQADTLYRYYTGEWGYRLTKTPTWFFRSVLEQKNPHRIGRITISDIGIGADSSPPRTQVKYSAGDIISPDKAGIDNIKIVIAYDKEDDQYVIDSIRQDAYNAGWLRSNSTIQNKRAFIERDYPYQIRKVDLSRVRIE
jgi:hypothetical protein